MSTTNDQTTGNSVITIRLGNQDFSLNREIRQVKDLKLDPSNQRISYKLRQKGLAATDKELHDMLWELDSVKDLFQSVLQNGGLIEDPIIRENDLVVEGNCRTVVLRELHKRYPKDSRFTRLYVMVLPRGVSEEQLTLLLGELHIAGKIEWRAFEQAEYVWKMNKVFGKSYDFLASHLRWSRSKLSQKILAYEETKAYIDKTSDPEGINRFSHFEEFMKKRELRLMMANDPDFIARFRDWVFAKKFPDAKDVRKLPQIIGNEDALKQFSSKGIKAAVAVLEKENPSLVSNFYSTIDSATSELKTVSLQEIRELKLKDSVKIQKFKELKEAISILEDYVGFQF